MNTIDRLRGTADQMRAAGRRKPKKPPTNDRGNIVITPEDLRRIERGRRRRERIQQPGPGRGGVHDDQNIRHDHRRRRRRDRQRDWTRED